MSTSRGSRMRWLLAGLCAGICLGGSTGCSLSRLGLAKSDSPKPPPKSADDNTEVRYGIPWGKKKNPDELAANEPKKSPEELQKDLDNRLAQSRSGTKPSGTRDTKIAELLRTAGEIESRGDLPAAKAAYQKVLDLDQRHGEAHHRLAVICDQMQDARAADEHYAAALAVNRRDADLLSDLGYSSFLRGRLDDSEKHLKAALEVNPYHRGAMGHLGSVYASQGKAEQALTMFRQIGTEKEAQQRLAQLMPGARPNGPAPAGTAGMALAGGTARLPLTASNDQRAAPPMPADIDRRTLSEGSSNLASMTMDDLRQQMQRERELAQRKREEELRREMRPELRDGGVDPAAFAQGSPAQPGGLAPGPMTPASGNGLGQGLAPNAAAGNFVAGHPTGAGNLPQSAGQFPTGNSTPGTAGKINPFVAAAAASSNSGLSSSGHMSPAAGSASPGFWQGNFSGVNLMPSPGPNPAAAAPANGPSAAPSALAGSNNNPWGPAAVTPAGYGTTIPSPGGANPAGTPATGVNAQRMAAQMALGAGPGAMFPAMGSGNGSSVSPGDLRWAHAESLQTNPNAGAVHHATLSQDGGRATGSNPGGMVQPAGFAAPMSTPGDGPQTTPLPPWANFNSPAMDMATPTWPGTTPAGTTGSAHFDRNSLSQPGPANGISPNGMNANGSNGNGLGPNGANTNAMNPSFGSGSINAGPQINPGVRGGFAPTNTAGNSQMPPDWSANAANPGNWPAPTTNWPNAPTGAANGSRPTPPLGPDGWPTPSSGNGARPASPATNGGSGNGTVTVPNWPYAPSRP